MIVLDEIDEWPSANLRHGIAESKISGFEDLNTVFTSPLLEKKEDYIFRGHRKNNWILAPTIDRFINKKDKINKLERQLIDFKKAILGRRGVNPPDLSDNEIWSLGQHFGLYSPLLDWTYSPYVALFFAFVEKGGDNDLTESRILFALNKKRVMEKSSQIADHSEIIEFYEPSINENSRLLSQSGLFTISKGNLDIEEWINNNFQNFSKIVLIKIHILNDLRIEILKQLNWMNINYLTLFPDLMGAAKHTNLKFAINNY